MRVEETAISGVLVITPERHADARGFFSETYRRDVLKAHGVEIDWVQDNHVHSAGRGVVRALHFQVPPAAQAKLIRVTRGAIYDVALDLRKDSGSYGRHIAVELSAENWRQLLVPAGFAHGYCTLVEDSEVLYKVDAPYAPETERGLLWNDPDLAIAWPISAQEAQLHARDRLWPRLRDYVSPF